MDSTTICKFTIFIGILQTRSLYHAVSVRSSLETADASVSGPYRPKLQNYKDYSCQSQHSPISHILSNVVCVGQVTSNISCQYAADGILFQVPEMVEWSKAECTCQKNHGKLFKPTETSFDVSLFRKFNFSDDIWVAATYINLISFESASKVSDSAIRCEMCKTEESCGTTCLYTACGNRCSALCEVEYVSGPPTHFLSDTQTIWTKANQLCLGLNNKLGDKIQNASSISHGGYCNNGCFWTRNLIQVQFQTKIAPSNEQGKCGILHNGTLSFTSCNRQLHQLCETESKIALEEESNNCISMNTRKTFLPTTRASRSTNRIKATINTSSTYGTSSVTNSISKSTAFGLNEVNTSLQIPVLTPTSRNDVADTPHKPDTGIIIGAVIGSVVFLTMTVLVIIYFRRRLLQRTGERKSEHESTSMNMQKPDKIHKSIYSYQCQDVPLETGPGLTPFVQLESKYEVPRSIIVGQISNHEMPASMFEPEGSNLNYATVTKKAKVNSSNSTYNTNYDKKDHLNGIQESRDDNVAGNVYDTANFEQRNGCVCTPDNIYSKTLDESVGLYDRVKAAISDEYDTTYNFRTDWNSTYDHI